MTSDVKPVGTVVVDLHQRIVHIDDQFLDIVGRDRDALIGQQALSFTYAEDVAANQPALDRLIAGGPGFTITKRYMRGDGAVIWVKNHVMKITNGMGSPLICATTERSGRPFASERLTRNYRAARQLCRGLVAGRRQLTPAIVQAPAIEALLLLYRAEIEGQSINVEQLAMQTGSAPTVMLRWVKLLQGRDLIVAEQPGPIGSRTCVRISASGERKLDGLLAGLSAG